MNRFQNTVLAIHASPGNVEAYCCGTLKLLKEKGFRIVIATLTAGGLSGVNMTMTQTILTRKKEAAAAAAVIGAEYFCFDLEDGFLFDSERMRHDMVEFIRSVNPGIIITHLPSDYHCDNRTVSNIVETGARLSTYFNLKSKEPPLDITPLLYYSAPIATNDPISGTPIKPNFYIDITTTLKNKMEMLSHHATQIEMMKTTSRIDNFFEKMKEYNTEIGKMAGVPYAEALWQRLGAGFLMEPVLQEILAEYLIPPENE